MTVSSASQSTGIAARRPFVLRMMSVFGLVPMVVLAIIMRSQPGVIYDVAAIIGVVACVIAFALTYTPYLDVGAWLLYSSFLGACLVGPLFGDLGILPLGLGPTVACSMVGMRREHQRAALMAALVTFALIVGVTLGLRLPSTADERELLWGGIMASAVTVLAVVYGHWERSRALDSAISHRRDSQGLLQQLEAANVVLESRVEEKTAMLTVELTETDALAHEYEQLALRDPLTGLLNRRHLEATWPRRVADSEVAGVPMSVLALDLDHFGRVNTDYSHETGDLVLREFADLIERCTREGDVVYRLGQGEEFAVLLPAADLELATTIAERLRQSAETSVWPGVDRKLTVSIGVAERLPGSDEDWEQVLERADSALFASKDSGRNKVTAHGSPTVAAQ